MSQEPGENGLAAQQLVEVVSQLAQGIDRTESGSGEPATKRVRTEDSDLDADLSVKQILFNINKAICLRLDAIENKMLGMDKRTKLLEDKVDKLLTTPSNPLASSTPGKNKSGAVIVGLPQENRPSSDDDNSNCGQGVAGLGPNVTLITLNTEEDYPDGTWLGDESNPEMRVRVPVTPSDLLHVHSNCRTAEKMALTLLDYLFDRETQASSNLSGMGKHGKKQLDPLMIYGIRCHLIHRFGITEQDWHRIKLNIDSKCRTAFRRKQKGMPLTVKAFHGKSPTQLGMTLRGMSGINSDGEDSMQESALTIHQPEGLDAAHSMATLHSQLGITQHGEVQILHATPEQIEQLREAHHIQVLNGDQVLQLKHGDLQGVDVAVSLAGTQTVQMVTTESGEVLQITQAADHVGQDDTSFQDQLQQQQQQDQDDLQEDINPAGIRVEMQQSGEDENESEQQEEVTIEVHQASA
ncbi:protein BANP isoform X1 [Lingula anatina]|uniref:Protein BANP n=2 Tax=Lingula anatina TaxID=7574 RepID=A0A1S3JFW1_LINAN|nr:protein BANP isoform X1 [Lingula anatina]XP_013409287.1 protein BANP isoform X1 [Lingula anatina]|eukprot:XP_013409279.1 protein BANP isoform X1 [Lingula anatina]